MTELRRAFRVFQKSPGYTAIAILSLAIAIAANSAIFSLWNAVALRTLATPEANRLAGLFTINSAGSRGNFLYSEFEKIREHQRSFSSLFLWEDGTIRTLDVDGVPFPGSVLLASDGFAETMRLRPAIGRGITAGDGAVAVLGYPFWRLHFQANPAVVGKTIRVQGRLFTIVGVAPEDFTNLEGGNAVDAIVPVAAYLPIDHLRADRTPVWSIAGRLNPGVSLERARSEMEALWPQVRPRPPFRIQVESAARGTGFNFARMRFTSPLQVLMGIVGLLLLLASVNLGTLLLSRADAQRRETGIRLALGANRVRILRLYLTESLLLASAGSMLGLLCARWMVGFLAQMVWTSNVERIHDVPLDGSVLAFATAAALGSGLIFGSIPALNAVKTDPITPLRQGGATVGGSSRTGRLLVMVQVALSLVLVVAATLFTGTLRDLKSQALGFNSSHVLGMALINRPDGYRGIDQVSYYRDLCERLAKVPGVRSVSSSSLPPVMPPFLPDQTVAAGDTAIGAQEILVAPGFFETMQIPLVAGRDFTFHDTAQTPRLAVLSESLARRLSVTVDQHVSLAGRDVQITGIVSDSGVGSLQKHNSSQVFTSTLQLESGPSTPYFLVRAAGVPTAMLAQQLSTEVESMGREYPIRIESMDRAIARALVQERLMASLGGGFGVLALILAVIGLYGLMSYTVVRRSRDIGVRLALGADPRGIVRMVVGEALTLVAAGLAMGIPAVYAASKTASAMLQGLNPLGVAPLAIASAVLLAAALLAAALPAHRAAKLDPMAALRE